MKTPPEKTFQGALVERIPRAPAVESFRFEVPEKMDFVPGQFVEVAFDPGNPRNRDLNKYLSFSSSPDRPYVEVTKKLSDSDFSRKLDALKPGAAVALRGPMGSCTFRGEYPKVGFLIGGIGITPVISIIEYIIDRDLETDAVLFYSNRSEEETAFGEQLRSWGDARKGLQVHCFVTRVEPKEGRCAFGRVSRQAILDRAADSAERHWYVFGPPKMVETMSGICREIGCPDDHLKTESFAGY